MIAPRRAFLQGLASLPLIGGSVALIGQPTAVAVAPNLRLVADYCNWLAIELGEALIERQHLKALRDYSDHPDWVETETAWRREWCGEGFLGCFGDFRKPPTALPSSRAALVLSTVGVDWRVSRT